MPKRLVIMLGGPMMNLIIAVVLLTVTMTGFGMPEQTPRLSSVSQCVLPGGRAGRPEVHAVRPGGPGRRAPAC